MLQFTNLACRSLVVATIAVSLSLFGCSDQANITNPVDQTQVDQTQVDPKPSYVPSITNPPPVIDCINCSTNSISPCGSVGICVTAHDPKGEPLTYGFYSLYGEISSRINQASWILPEAEGTYRMYVMVGDGYNKVIEAIDVEVSHYPIRPAAH